MRYQKMHVGKEQETIILQVVALSEFIIKYYLPSPNVNS